MPERGEVDDDIPWVHARRGGSQFPMTNWDKINFAAEGSGVLLGLLVTGDEKRAQERLDGMSSEQLLILERWTGILDELVWNTRARRLRESHEGQAP